jgi:hypothetical protein
MRKTKEVLRLRFELGLGQRAIARGIAYAWISRRSICCRSIEKGKKQIHLGAILEQ